MMIYIFFYKLEFSFIQFCAGPALVTTKDAGDAVTLLQSLAGSTFDSSQLVLTACMGYQNVNEERLEHLRNKHRPAVEAALIERTKGLRMWRDSQGKMVNGALSRMNSGSSNADELYVGVSGDVEIDSLPDLQEQVRLHIVYIYYSFIVSYILY